MQLLLERGDRNQLHIKDNRGDTALHKAAWQGNEKVVELLLNNGADIHSTNNKGQQPLDIAIQYGKNSKKKPFNRFLRLGIHLCLPKVIEESHIYWMHLPRVNKAHRQVFKLQLILIVFFSRSQ